jgi:hypothetical protein
MVIMFVQYIAIVRSLVSYYKIDSTQETLFLSVSLYGFPKEVIQLSKLLLVMTV